MTAPQATQSLVTLCAAHAAYERIPYSGIGHGQRLGAALASGQLHAWLLERDGVAAGYASVTLDFATLSGLHFAHLDCLYLAPSARGQGGGMVLMRTIRAFAVRQGCAELQWQTPDWNQDAIRFYSRFGPTVTGKQRYSLPLAP